MHKPLFALAKIVEIWFWSEKFSSAAIDFFMALQAKICQKSFLLFE